MWRRLRPARAMPAPTRPQPPAPAAPAATGHGVPPSVRAAYTYLQINHQYLSTRLLVISLNNFTRKGLEVPQHAANGPTKLAEAWPHLCGGGTHGAAQAVSPACTPPLAVQKKGSQPHDTAVRWGSGCAGSPGASGTYPLAIVSDEETEAGSAGRPTRAHSLRNALQSWRSIRTALGDRHSAHASAFAAAADTSGDADDDGNAPAQVRAAP